MSITRVFFYGLVVLFSLGCVNKDKGFAPEEQLSVVLEEVVDHSIIPSVEAFHVSATEFQATVDQFCATKNENNLQALQQSWTEMFERWYRLSIYNFGPINDDLVFPAYTFIDSLRLRGTNYLETVRNEISSDIAASTDLNESYFTGKTFQEVGLLALEVAVYETASAEHSQIAADIVNEYQTSSRKCEVLNGLLAQLVKHASYVEAGWISLHKNSEESYRTLFLADQLDDGAAPHTQLIVSVQEFLDYLQKRNVVLNAAQLSGHSWSAISATIDEVETLLQGTDATTDSIFNLMVVSGNQNAVDTVKATIAAVRKSIEDRDETMLEITLGQLDGNFKREIPDSLDVELGINFTDGD